MRRNILKIILGITLLNLQGCGFLHAHYNNIFNQAVYDNNMATMKLLLLSGADINGKYCVFSNYGMKYVKVDATPLGMAVVHDNYEAVKFLLENGADIKEGVYYGESIIDYAALRGNGEIVDLLLKYYKLKNIHMDLTEALVYASRGKNSKIIKYLIDAGANVNAKTKDGITPIAIAIVSGNENNVVELIKYGANVNIALGYGSTPLKMAKEMHLKNIITSLTSAGAID